MRKLFRSFILQRVKEMKKKSGFIWLFIIYSIVLIGLEFMGSSQTTSSVCSRINSSVSFYAINSTICYFLLWSSSLLLLLCIHYNSLTSQEKAFFFTQMTFFFLLGICERFIGYQRASEIFSIHPIFLVCSVLALEGFLLMVLMPENFSYNAKTCLYRAFFMVLFMLVLDSLDAMANSYVSISPLFPHLCKTWACIYLFFFSWNTLDAKMQLPKNGHRLTNQIVTKRTMREHEEN